MNHLLSVDGRERDHWWDLRYLCGTRTWQRDALLQVRMILRTQVMMIVVRVSRCETCWPETGCYRPEHYHTYYVDQYGQVEGETPEQQELNMMTEIFNHGPISCAIAVTDELVAYSGGIFTGPLNATQVNHDISVVGYGEENGQKYWIIRNSWVIQGKYFTWNFIKDFRVLTGVKMATLD